MNVVYTGTSYRAESNHVMVKINKIYTRTGDTGTTHLVGGMCIRKDSLRVCAYGDIDELNSHMGLVRTLCGNLEHREMLRAIQNNLFDLGAELATSEAATIDLKAAISENAVTELEHWIDALTSKLAPLKSFVLPGGTILNAHLHIARTICRRAERKIIALSQTETIRPEVIMYTNRLSDFLFALARMDALLNDVGEYLWEPGAYRS